MSFFKKTWVWVLGASLFLLSFVGAYAKGRRDKGIEEALRAFREKEKNKRKREEVAKRYENKENQDINDAFARVGKLSRKL